MDTQTNKFNEKQKKSKLLAFLLYLHKLIPTDKFVPVTLISEEEKYQISNDFLSAIFREKIIAIDQTGQVALYKWASIRPNIFMVDALIKSEQNHKEEQIKKSFERPVQEVKPATKKDSPDTVTNPQPKEEPKITTETLRPYQIEGIRNIFAKWTEEKRSVLFQMPTGTGKTVLFSEIVKIGFQKQRKILIVVHRIELIEQITKKLNGKGITVGHIVSGIASDYSKIVQVASIQTLSRREYPEANLIIIDECHHSKAATYKELWNIYPDAKFLGVTATPYRLSGEGFSDLFEELIVSMSVNDFIKQKYLVPITHYACATPNLTTVRKSKGDYVTKMLSDVMLDNSIMSDVVDSYIENCKDKSAIVFAVDVEHSKEIAERFKKQGINAEHIDAKTPKELRERILDDFRNRKIQVVSNVEIITEGFDFPECEAVILARPTKSLSLYLQMVGRVMRTASGKTEGVVLDNAGLWLEHGLSTIDRDWTLENIQKKKNETHHGDLVAIDKDGFLREVNRTRPSEMKGLKLIPLTFELKRLMIFEKLASNAKFKGHKLVKSYLEYRDYVQEGGNQLSMPEFNYIKKRLTFLSTKVPTELAVNEGFWYHEYQRLKNPISEERQKTFVKKQEYNNDMPESGNEPYLILNKINNQLYQLQEKLKNGVSLEEESILKEIMFLQQQKRNY